MKMMDEFTAGEICIKVYKNDSLMQQLKDELYPLCWGSGDSITSELLDKYVSEFAYIYIYCDNGRIYWAEINTNHEGKLRIPVTAGQFLSTKQVSIDENDVFALFGE